MGGLDLSERDLRELRALLSAEPVPGQPLPPGDVLLQLNALVPCDLMAMSYVDMTGLVTATVYVESNVRGCATVVSDLDKHEQHDGPFYVGYMHWTHQPAQAEACGIMLDSRDDALAIGFRNGTEHIVQYAFGRERRRFSGRELAIFDLLGPVLQRLARERPTPSLPAALTISERRVLCDVAAGLSNAEIAEGSCIAISTVRKHLENAYRKLGVTSRHAAIARLRGSDHPGLDLHERVTRYA